MYKKIEKPIFPDGIDLRNVPKPLQDFIFEMEEYTRELQEHKAYYRRTVSMLCTEIEQGGFSNPEGKADATAIRQYAITV